MDLDCLVLYFKSWALGALGGLPRDSLRGLVVMMPCWVKYTRAPPCSRDPCGVTDLGRHSVHTRWAVPGCAELTSMVSPSTPEISNSVTRCCRSAYLPPPRAVSTQPDRHPSRPSLQSPRAGGLRNGYVVALNHSYFCVSRPPGASGWGGGRVPG